MNLEKVDEEYETKMVAFESDCNDGKGVPLACHQVGEFFSVVKDNHEKAAKVYNDNCSRNNYGPSCFNLGRLYLSGRGVVQNDNKAEIYFDKACKEGHLASCHNQGLLLFTTANKALQSPDPPPDELTRLNNGFQIIEKACVKGQSDSCYFAGGILIRTASEKEKHFPIRDPLKALTYFKIACSANHAPSCYNLAVMYKHGDTGVPKNDEKFEIYRDRTNELIELFGGIEGTKKA